MCNCGCDSSLLTIPKGDTGVTGATGPAGPQGPQGDPGPAGTNTKVISEGASLSLSLAGAGYDKIFTCVDPIGPYTAGEWGLWGSVWIETTGSQTIEIEYFADIAGSGYITLGGAQTHITAGSNTLIPLCMPGTLLGMSNGDKLKVNVKCTAGGTIKARNTNMSIK